MNPAFMPPPPMPFSNASNAPGGGRFAVRDKLVGQRVIIGGRGLDKGKEGTVKDVNGNLYRVELSSTNKFVNVAKAQLFVYE
jgi:transcription elongation factor